MNEFSDFVMVAINGFSHIVVVDPIYDYMDIIVTNKHNYIISINREANLQQRLTQRDLV